MSVRPSENLRTFRPVKSIRSSNYPEWTLNINEATNRVNVRIIVHVSSDSPAFAPTTGPRTMEMDEPTVVSPTNKRENHGRRVSRFVLYGRGIKGIGSEQRETGGNPKTGQASRWNVSRKCRSCLKLSDCVVRGKTNNKMQTNRRSGRMLVAPITKGIIPP